MNKEIVAEIQNLESQHGEITAELIYQFGKKPGSAIHEYLKTKDVFDKNKAQYHWAIEVCRDLIRKIEVVTETTEYIVKVPKYVRNPDAAPNKQSMVNINSLNNSRKKDALTPYLQRALSNVVTAINISEGTGCTELLEVLEDNIKNCIKKVKDQKVKPERIEKKPAGKQNGKYNKNEERIEA